MINCRFVTINPPHETTSVVLATTLPRRRLVLGACTILSKNEFTGSCPEDSNSSARRHDESSYAESRSTCSSYSLPVTVTYTSTRELFGLSIVLFDADTSILPLVAAMLKSKGQIAVPIFSSKVHACLVSSRSSYGYVRIRKFARM